MGSKGHGTIITGAGAQGDARVYVSSNDGDENYSANQEAPVVNDTGATLVEGQIVELEFINGQLKATGLTTRGQGNVLEDGGYIQITDSGNTGLSGTVAISTSNGENAGWGGTSDVYFGNVDGEAAYLGES